MSDDGKRTCQPHWRMSALLGKRGHRPTVARNALGRTTLVVKVRRMVPAISDCQRSNKQSPSGPNLPTVGLHAVSYWLFAGAPGSTAATPSGLMLKAKNVNGSSPGFPHWWTRPYGS